MVYWTELAGYWLSSLCVHERGQYPAILTKQAWPIKDLLYGFGDIFRASKRHLAHSGSQSQQRTWIILRGNGAMRIVMNITPAGRDLGLASNEFR